MQHKQQNSIKLIRGQRGKYGWEIKLIGKNDMEIKTRLDKLDKEMVKSYDNLNNKEVKNNGTKY